MENILTNVLSTVSREDNRRRGTDTSMLDSLEPPEGGLSIGTDPVADAKPTVKPKTTSKTVEGGTKKRKSPAVHQGFSVRLIRGEGKRSELIGNTIMVDIEHPDFKSRLRKNRTGHDRFDDRICSYLATIIAAHYQDRRYVENGYQPDNNQEAFQDMINVYVRLEAKLRKNLPSLIRQMEEIEKEGF